MPDLLPKGLLRRLRLLAPLFVAALSLYALPVSCLAQTVPASLRACTAESDSTGAWPATTGKWRGSVAAPATGEPLATSAAAATVCTTAATVRASPAPRCRRHHVHRSTPSDIPAAHCGQTEATAPPTPSRLKSFVGGNASGV